MTASCLLVGASGLLGGALDRTLSHRHRISVDRARIDWSQPSAPTQLRSLAESFTRETDDWTVFWAAGAGVIGTEPRALERETECLGEFLAGLASASHGGRLILASSAGGVHGDPGGGVFDETCEPAPQSQYGRNKLLQERMTTEWAAETGSRALIARISTLYGPGQSLEKAQGLLSHAVRSTIAREPLHLWVPIDTLRDYLYVDDCAETLARCASRLAFESAGSATTKLVASGESLSIAAVLGEIQRVVHRRPLVVSHPADDPSAYSAALVFRTRVWADLDARPITPLAAGLYSLAAQTRAKLARSTSTRT